MTRFNTLLGSPIPELPDRNLVDVRDPTQFLWMTSDREKIFLPFSAWAYKMRFPQPGPVILPYGTLDGRVYAFTYRKLYGGLIHGGNHRLDVRNKGQLHANEGMLFDEEQRMLLMLAFNQFAKNETPISHRWRIYVSYEFTEGQYSNVYRRIRKDWLTDLRRHRIPIMEVPDIPKVFNDSTGSIRFRSIGDQRNWLAKLPEVFAEEQSTNVFEELDQYRVNPGIRHRIQQVQQEASVEVPDELSEEVMEFVDRLNNALR